MPAPATIVEFVQLSCKAGLLERNQVDSYFQHLRQAPSAPSSPRQVADAMIADGLLTSFQAQQLLLGRWHGFILSKKYRLLECIGSGGMGSVFLCEHLVMHRLVAIKVLPQSQAKDPANLERFYREARAVAALNHPNIIRAHDIDRDANLHYLVMEFVEGSSLQQIIKDHGPMGVYRAAHYIAQAAAGLQRAHLSGLVHRDIKPANLLLERTGVVKVLDLGLARFFHEGEGSITKKHDAGAVLGTADYLSPEQAMDSSAVDIRADIYSLGATFYFLLAGHAPFHDKTVHQKIVCHQMRQPKPIQALRKDVPDVLAAVLDRMMAKQPEDRYQQPQDVVQALAGWTQTPIPPPPEKEMPRPSARYNRDWSAPDPGGMLTGPTEITRPPVSTDADTVVRRRPDTDPIGYTAVSPATAPATDQPNPDAGNRSGPSTAELSLEETHPFIPDLTGSSGSLVISEDSVFFSQLARPGSSRRMSSVRINKAPLRAWMIVAALAVLGVGGWFLVGQLSTPDSTTPKGKDQNQTNSKPLPDANKLAYQAAGSLFGQLVRVVDGHHTPITGLALSADGKHLITTAKERTAKLWENEQGRFVSNLVGHAQPIAAVTFSPDGKMALTCGWDNSLCLWEGQNGYNSPWQKSTELEKPLLCVAFAPGGQQAVSGGEDHLVRLWDLKTMKMLRPFKGHTKPVRSVAFAPDGQRILSGSEDKTVRLWEAATGKELAHWNDHKEMVLAVAFSPDGRFAASASQDRHIILWDTEQNKKRHILKGHTAGVVALAFSGDGRYLISAGEDGTTRVWEVITGQEIYRFPDQDQAISAMAISQDGTLLALGGSTEKARLYRMPAFLHTSLPGLELEAKGQPRSVETLALSPDGKRFASAGLDRIIRLWDATTLKQVKTFVGHLDSVYSLAFSPDGQRLLSASKDKTVRLWNVDTAQSLFVYKGHAGAVHQAIFTPDGQQVLSVGEEGEIRLWEVAKGKIEEVKKFPEQEWPIWAVAFSHDGKRFATSSADGLIRLWETATGKELRQIAPADGEPMQLWFTPKGSLLTAGGDQKQATFWHLPLQGKPVSQPLAGHGDRVTAVAQSRDGRYALTGAKNGEIILWDLVNLRPLYFFDGHKGAIRDIVFTPDNRQALTAGEDGSVRLWNLPPVVIEAGTSTNFAPHPLEVNGLSLSPDGRIAATACNDTIIRLWDITTGKELAKLTGHTRPVLSVEFSPDGKWLLSGGVAGSMRLWNVQTGKEVHLFSGHKKPVHATAFSPDGKRFLSASADGTACLWGSETGEKLQTFSGHDAEILGAVFTPDGNKILTASADKTLRLWDVDTGKTLRKLTGHTAGVLTVAISPDGRFALSGGEDNKVLLWDLEEAKLVHTFPGHKDAIRSVAFSADGLYALSGSADLTLRLWDLAKRQPASPPLIGHAGPVTGVAFTPDGLHAVTCSQDRTLRRWTLPVARPAAVAGK